VRRSCAGLGQHLLDHLREVVIRELARGDVHAHASVPLDGATGRLAQDEAPERDDQAGVLGHRYELARGDLPAAQRLEGGDVRADGAHDRLEDDLQRLVLDRPSEVGLQIEACEHVAVHLHVEDGVARRALRLGAVHRHVGVPDQLVRIDVRPAERDADRT
jgi:hypothetical protein